MHKTALVIYWFVSMAFLLMSGCTSVAVSLGDVNQYPTVQSLFLERFKKEWLAKDQDDLAKPLTLAKNYCAQQGGTLYRTGDVEQANNFSSLIQRPNSILWLQAKFTGEFECKFGSNSHWRVDIALINKRCNDCFNPMQFIYFDEQQTKQGQAIREEAAAASEKRLQKIKQEIALAADEAQKKREFERQSAQATIPHGHNIGRKICKFGHFEVSYSTGYAFRGEPQYETIPEPGNLVATLESHSSDRTRIQFRIVGWSPVMPLNRNKPYLPPKLGDFVVQPGTLYWDEVFEWKFC